MKPPPVIVIVTGEQCSHAKQHGRLALQLAAVTPELTSFLIRDSLSFQMHAKKKPNRIPLTAPNTTIIQSSTGIQTPGIHCNCGLILMDNTMKQSREREWVQSDCLEHADRKQEHDGDKGDESLDRSAQRRIFHRNSHRTMRRENPKSICKRN